MKYIYVGYIAVRANLFSFNALKTGLIWTARVVCCAVLASLLSNLSFLNVGKIYMSFANGLEMAAALLVYSSIIDGKKHVICCSDRVGAAMTLYLWISRCRE